MEQKEKEEEEELIVQVCCHWVEMLFDAASKPNRRFPPLSFHFVMSARKQDGKGGVLA